MIQIIDGFKLQTSTPIDSRIVVADDTERTSMSNKYHGLRVWQVDTNIPYFWNGAQWESELDLVVTGSGSINNVPKFSSSTPSILTDSQISDDGATVDISNNLLVGNDITFSGYLYGDLNADNILSGSLDLDRLNTSSAGTDYVLQYDGTSPEWVDLNSISIGTSTNTDSIKVENVAPSNKYSLILRDETSTLGNFLPLYSYNSDLFFSEKSGSMCILAPDGSVSNPPYSFDGDTNTGMYRPSASAIGFSSNGGVQMKIDSNGVHINSSYATDDFVNVNTIGVPIGGIVMYTGDVNNIGNGDLWNFVECKGYPLSSLGTLTDPDGNVINLDLTQPIYQAGGNFPQGSLGAETPDMRDRFPLGSSYGSSTNGQSGGDDKITDEIVIEEEPQPANIIIKKK